jgi:hypothetical protein
MFEIVVIGWIDSMERYYYLWASTILLGSESHEVYTSSWHFGRKAVVIHRVHAHGHTCVYIGRSGSLSLVG